MIYTNAFNGISFNSEAYLHLRNMLSTVILGGGHLAYDSSDDIYLPKGSSSPGYDEYGNYINKQTDVYDREEWFLKRAIGESNERNVPGVGMALALAGCFGGTKSPAEEFPYLSMLSTISDIANSTEAKNEILKNKNTFRLVCMSDYLKGILNLPIVETPLATDSIYVGSVQVTTTGDRPFIYIWLDGYEPTGARYSKVNLISNGVTRNIWTSPTRSGAGRDSSALALSKHLVIDPVAEYSLGRTVTVQFTDITSNTRPIFTAS